MTAAFCLFDTALGRCAIAWRGAAVIAVALPEADENRLAARMVARGAAPADAPDPLASRAIDGIRRLLEGEPLDLADIPVDLAPLPPFESRVLEALRLVPHGQTVTYGELAARCGAPGAARAVGAAMGRNPAPIIIPCHRVLAGGGRSGGFSAPGGVTTKFRILAIEQAHRGGDALLFDNLPLAVCAGR